MRGKKVGKIVLVTFDEFLRYVTAINIFVSGITQPGIEPTTVQYS